MGVVERPLERGRPTPKTLLIVQGAISQKHPISLYIPASPGIAGDWARGTPALVNGMLSHSADDFRAGS